jgi:Glycosyl transferase family 2
MTPTAPSRQTDVATTADVRPLVTIAIPTYNRAAQTLRCALESALAQTYPNLEILISDNASTDTTDELVRGYADARIRYVRHPSNIGANNNFNFCVDDARGVYVLILHDDDLIDADFIEVCMSSTDDDTSYGVIRTGMRIIDSDGRLLSELPNQLEGASSSIEFLQAWFRGRTSPYCCNTLCNVAHLRALGGFHSRHNLFQDTLAQFRLTAAHGQFDVSAVKASFRQHAKNAGSAATIADWCDDTLQLYQAICEVLPEQSDALRMEGKRYLCAINYGYVASLASPLRKAKTYLQVADAFDHAFPLAEFIVDHDLMPRVRAFRRRLGDQVPGLRRLFARRKPDSVGSLERSSDRARESMLCVERDDATQRPDGNARYPSQRFGGDVG